MTINTTIPNSTFGTLAASPLTGGRQRGDAPASWFEALANAWGNTLDNQAAKIEMQSQQVGGQGGDQPSQIVQLTTESLRMSFLANGSSTSIDTVGKALETMARKG